MYSSIGSDCLEGKVDPQCIGAGGSHVMAEMKNMLLTVGHDLDIVQLPFTWMFPWERKVIP